MHFYEQILLNTSCFTQAYRFFKGNKLHLIKHCYDTLKDVIQNEETFKTEKFIFGFLSAVCSYNDNQYKHRIRR